MMFPMYLVKKSKIYETFVLVHLLTTYAGWYAQTKPLKWLKEINILEPARSEPLPYDDNRLLNMIDVNQTVVETMFFI